jgi:succinate-acetate transporter protein
MKLSDHFAIAALVSFGLWWLIFPGSVIKFYRWFHRGRVATGRPAGIRLAGLAWIVLVIFVCIWSYHSRQAP